MQQAAVRALADRPTADPTLVDPLVRLLDPQTADPVLTAAGDALVAFKGDPHVLDQLIARATAGDERVRAVAAKALGTFVDKRAAGALVGLTDPTANPPAVANAADAAMAYLTGLDADNTDAAGWRAWWAANQGKDETQFRADLSAARSARYDRLRTTSAGFADEVQRTLADVYKRTPGDQKANTLLGFLRAGDPTFRTIGCRIALDAAKGDPFQPEPVKEQLRLLVGDAHVDVRLYAAKTLAAINDRTAATALLTQLNQESDSRVRGRDRRRAAADPRPPGRRSAAVAAGRPVRRHRPGRRRGAGRHAGRP